MRRHRVKGDARNMPNILSKPVRTGRHQTGSVVVSKDNITHLRIVAWLLATLGKEHELTGARPWHRGNIVIRIVVPPGQDAREEQGKCDIRQRPTRPCTSMCSSQDWVIMNMKPSVRVQLAGQHAK